MVDDHLGNHYNPQCDVFKSAHSAASGIFVAVPNGLATTPLPSTGSEALGAVASAAVVTGTSLRPIATSLPASLLPKNGSADLKRICFGFEQNLKCANPSIIFPKQVQKAMSRAGLGFQPITSAARLSFLVKTLLFIGLTVVFALFPLFLASVLGRFLCIASILLKLGSRSKLIVHLILAFACCAPSFLLGLILHTLKTKTVISLAGIGVARGSIGDFYTIGLACIGCATFLTAVAPLMT